MNFRVKKFMEKHGHDIDVSLPSDYDLTLRTASNMVGDWANLLEKKIDKDARIIRAHLMCEELSEVLAALYKGDKLLLLDGLTDLLYVVYGTAITFGLPLDKAFDEIHKSNMTKAVIKNDPRVRIKGDNYVEPNLQRILDENH